MDPKYNQTPEDCIDNAIKFICANTELTVGNVPDFRKVTGELFMLKEELKAKAASE